ncbi:hypothetical protein FGO68_gene17448 [Halteria grandinella]|uniref:Uncharacterized protein n=1 Tax=Halteria grandinella TaxID=5974 RepID=A0A8J8T868_HALGN|nr:hypothetical protein FGO68_gene17448 [Halteria grandinella]
MRAFMLWLLVGPQRRSIAVRLIFIIKLIINLNVKTWLISESILLTNYSNGFYAILSIIMALSVSKLRIMNKIHLPAFLGWERFEWGYDGAQGLFNGLCACVSGEIKILLAL